MPAGSPRASGTGARGRAGAAAARGRRDGRAGCGGRRGLRAAGGGSATGAAAGVGDGRRPADRRAPGCRLLDGEGRHARPRRAGTTSRDPDPGRPGAALCGALDRGRVALDADDRRAAGARLRHAARARRSRSWWRPLVRTSPRTRPPRRWAWAVLAGAWPRSPGCPAVPGAAAGQGRRGRADRLAPRARSRRCSRSSLLGETLALGVARRLSWSSPAW